MTHQQAVEKQSVERYLLDEMPEIERFAFEEHLFDCDICAEDVRAGAVMREGVAAGLLPEAVTDKTAGERQKAEDGLEPPAFAKATAGKQAPSPPPSPRLRRASRPQAPTWRTALPWAVAAKLALAVGYQSLWVVPELRSRVIGPAVLSPVTLRGASRGTEPTLTRPATGVISLAVDLTGVAAGARLTYDLRAADGTSVASGTAAAPPPGTPLLLLIPASALESAGRYVLAVGTGDGPGSASVEYRFTLESEK
jgi:anti-sigma factor RsiW